ncbi:MAG: hypothetical protein J6L69_06815 [Lachnospiraceae bacterium]|nr:hypothetical protein [Lachnospiraceae bacterium]
MISTVEIYANDNISTIISEETDVLQSNTDDGNNNNVENIIKINEKLYDLYGTWTSIIAIIAILITILGFAVPLYNSKKIDRKIENAICEIKKENELINKKQLLLNNALMLSASSNYYSSNKILNRLVETDKSNSYLHLLIGRNIFHKYETVYIERELDYDEINEIEKAIKHFLFVADNSDKDEEYYELGSVFSDSIIHELCMLTNRLIEFSIMHEYTGNYHKLAIRVIKAIEDLLGIKEFDDIVNEEQSNVHIMNYIILNHMLAKSYLHYGNIKAKEQYEYTIKLYSISKELDYEKEINDCYEAINSILKR